MMQARGVFGRVLFELSFQGKERADAIQGRVSDFARHRLDGILSGCLARVISDQDVLAFEKVELDLGRIAGDALEQELASGIDDCLRDWLSHAVPLRRQPEWEIARDESRNPVGAPLAQTKQGRFATVLAAGAGMNSAPNEKAPA